MLFIFSAFAYVTCIVRYLSCKMARDVIKPLLVPFMSSIQAVLPSNITHPKKVSPLCRLTSSKDGMIHIV